jgi:hypothetical protein
MVAVAQSVFLRAMASFSGTNPLMFIVYGIYHATVRTILRAVLMFGACLYSDQDG